MPSRSSAQNATFRCPLCPRNFTRAFNLRGHVRTHTNERPFVCRVCGRAFTRQHDCRTHEQLHNREIKWVCGGVLENGKSWGCGRRYDRKSNLSRHRRSKIGRGCIKPTSDGDSAEESTGVEERPDMQLPIPSQPPPLPTNAEHSAAIALTDISRTLNISELSGVPSAQAKLSQETALARNNNASTSVDWRHTAAVHKLVMWPSVKILLHPHGYDQENLMKLERQRESTYASLLRDIPPSADDSVLSTPSLAHDGARGRSKSNPNETSIAHAGASFIDSCVQIDQYGVFKLSEKTSRRYYQSYLERMHILHPFLDEQELDLKVEAFIKCHSPRTSILITETNRCHASEEVTGGRLDAPSSPGQIVEPNIDNAIILLIFAVGAICDSEFTTPSTTINQRAGCHCLRFSGPVRKAPLGNSTHTVNDFSSPAPFHCAQQNLASIREPLQCSGNPFPFTASTPKLGDNGSRRMTHIGRDECGNVRIQAVVPGLALYRIATATVNRLRGARNLEYVHACLLAGLYAGQLADPFQSHVWFSEAAQACQLLVQRPSFDNVNDHTKDLRKFAYWSCLQLESNLLAELDIPASGISRYENRVFPPSGRYPTNGPDGLISPSTIMMMYYSSHIYLQNIQMMNQEQESHLPSVQKAQVTNLKIWRSMLPLPLEWKDTDEPAKNINAAHMRAIYYRIKYILHLPLLYYTIQYGQPSAWDERDAQFGVDWLTSSIHTSDKLPYQNYACLKDMLSAMNSDTNNSFLAFPQDWSPPTFDRKELPTMVHFACRTCVECAIQSLTAFDGIEDRLVVPNIFGTAHEQFGYMLVLSATYNSSLSELVDRSTLDRLFKRTICFLLQSENNSPTLRADIRILEDIYSKLLRRPSTPTDT